MQVHSPFHINFNPSTPFRATVAVATIEFFRLGTGRDGEKGRHEGCPRVMLTLVEPKLLDCQSSIS